MVEADKIKWKNIVAEGVAIVVSILLAFSVQAWWTNREAAELEQLFLSQLVEDLRQAELELAEEIEETERTAQAVVDLLAVARGDRTAENSSIADWVTLAGWWGDPLAPLSAAQVLATSENLFVIQNTAIRRGIVQLLDRFRYAEPRIHAWEERVANNYKIVNRRIDPIARGQAMYVGVGDGEFEAFTESQAEQGGPSVSWDPLFDDPEFRANFTDLFWSHENRRWLQRFMLEAIEVLREDVEAEIRRLGT